MPDNQTLLKKYLHVRSQTDFLSQQLTTEDHVAQPVTDVSPPKWHLAHTSWFFERFVLTCFKDYKVFHDRYNYLFNSYYETVGERWQRSQRGHLTRPGVDEIRAYRAWVDEAMTRGFESGKFPPELMPVIELGINHEQQHQELLITDLKYILGINPLYPAFIQTEAPAWPEITDDESEWTRMDEGIYEIGNEGTDFHFDNEEKRHRVFLEAFNYQDRLVTNEEYQAFMEDGGYENFRFWLMEGWEWVKANEVRAPLYWVKEDGKWMHFTLYGLKDIHPKEPVTHISFYEAEAFAAWAGKRLLTETEWEVAASLKHQDLPAAANLLDKRMFHPQQRIPGADQMIGDCWEWTQSAYLPYPGFKAPEGAIGEYNGKFMVNQMVLRGGSCATPADHIRLSYRNFFHPHLRWQFTGIRLAESIQ